MPETNRTQLSSQPSKLNKIQRSHALKPMRSRQTLFNQVGLFFDSITLRK